MNFNLLKVLQIIRISTFRGFGPTTTHKKLWAVDRQLIKFSIHLKQILWHFEQSRSRQVYLQPTVSKPHNDSSKIVSLCLRTEHRLHVNVTASSQSCGTKRCVFECFCLQKIHNTNYIVSVSFNLAFALVFLVISLPPLAATAVSLTKIRISSTLVLFRRNCVLKQKFE